MLSKIEALMVNIKSKSKKGFTPLEIRPAKGALAATRDGLFLTGFSLTELLVSMGIFILVFEVIIGILIFNIQMQRRLLIEQEMVSELSFTLEYISRALRLAIKEDGSFNCLPMNANYSYFGAGSSGIQFINHLQGDDCQRFFLEDGILKYSKGVGSAGGKTFPLTSPGFVITALKFQLLGQTSGDNFQPRATIVLRAAHSELPMPIILQTTVSQRRLDVN